MPKLFLFLLLFLLLFFFSRESALVDFNKFINDSISNNTLNVILKPVRYILRKPLNILGLSFINITGSSESSISCSTPSISKLPFILIENSSQVHIINLIFDGCLGERYKDSNLALVKFKNVYELNINNCHMSNITGNYMYIKNSVSVYINNSYLDGMHRHSKGIIYSVNNLPFIHDRTYKLTVNNTTLRKFNNYRMQIDDNGIALNYFINETVLAHFHMENSIVEECINSTNGAVNLKNQEYVTEGKWSFVNSSFRGNKGNESGGAINLLLYSAKTRFEITSCHFSHNSATNMNGLAGGNGGALLVDIDYGQNFAKQNKAKSYIRNSIFMKNFANIGGAVSIVSTEEVTTPQQGIWIYDCKFINNTAIRGGGAIWVFNAAILFRDKSIFLHNSAIGESGGAIYLTSSILSINGSLAVLNNTANINGGGLYLTGLASQIILWTNTSKITISNNTARIRGGGLYVRNTVYEFVGLVHYLQNSKETYNCFFKHSADQEHRTISFINNVVNQNKQYCSGDAIYGNVLNFCEKTQNKLTSDVFHYSSGSNNSVCQDSNQIKFFISSPVTCNLSTWTAESPNVSARNFLNFHCKKKFYSAANSSTKLHILLNQASQLLKLNRNLNTTFLVYFPSYTELFHIKSFDVNNRQVIDHIKITLNLTDTNGKYQQGSFIVKGIPHKELYISSLFDDKIKLHGPELTVGTLCAESFTSVWKPYYCRAIIFGNCPPGFIYNRETSNCDCSRDLIRDQCTIRSYNITAKPGTYYEAFNNSIEQAKCPYFRCKCNPENYPNGCSFSLLNKDDQCINGLKGRLCAKCLKKHCIPFNTALMKNFYFKLFGVKEACIGCHLYGYFIYFAVSIIFVIIAVYSKMDAFGHGTRSIIFYGNMLYVLIEYSQYYINDYLLVIVSICLAFTNYAFLFIIPSCIYKEPINFQVENYFFEISGPLFLAFIAFILSYLSKYSKGLSKLHILDPVCSILIMSYTKIVVLSLRFLRFVQLKDQYIWVYSGEPIFKGSHLAAFIIAIFILLVLFMIPVYLCGMANAEVSKHFTHYYTNRFKKSFRNWELLKLALRILVPTIFISGEVFRHEDYASYIAGFLFLILMVVNSTFQPANTGLKNKDLTQYLTIQQNPPHFLSNSFESLCFMLLAFVSFHSNKQPNGGGQSSFVTLYHIIIFPFAIFILYKAFKFAKYCQMKFKSIGLLPTKRNKIQQLN